MWDICTNDELKVSCRRICNQSNDEATIRQRILTELGYPYSSHSIALSGSTPNALGDRMWMGTLWTRDGESLSF